MRTRLRGRQVQIDLTRVVRRKVAQVAARRAGAARTRAAVRTHGVDGEGRGQRDCHIHIGRCVIARGAHGERGHERRADGRVDRAIRHLDTRVRRNVSREARSAGERRDLLDAAGRELIAAVELRRHQECGAASTRTPPHRREVRRSCGRSHARRSAQPAWCSSRSRKDSRPHCGSHSPAMYAMPTVAVSRSRPVIRCVMPSARCAGVEFL